MSTRRRARTVLAPVMRWDYGQQSRGPSLEDSFFLTALRELVEDVQPLWIDGWMDSPAELTAQVLAAADRVRPDLVFFVPARDEVQPQLLEALHRTTVTLAWFGDDQWRFDSYTCRYAPLFSHAVTTAPERVPDYRRLGVEPIVSQWAAQPAGPLRGPASEAELRYDVSFVGGANAWRRWFVGQLGRRGHHVHCWGSGWPAGRLSFQDVAEVFRTSRVNLNLSNSVSQDLRFVLSSPGALRDYARSPKRHEQVKARHFEIPLAGGFQLSNHVPGLEDYFDIGRELAVYTAVDDCAQQLDRVRAEPERRADTALAGFERARREHTYEHRLERVLQRVWEH